MTPAEKFELGCEVRARADILPTYRLLFAAALDRYNCKTGRCDPAISTLASDIGVSVNTARRGLVVLEEHGLIGRVRRSGKTAQSGSRQLPLPQLWDGSREQPLNWNVTPPKR